MELYDALFYRKSIKGYSSKVIKKPLLEEIKRLCGDITYLNNDLNIKAHLIERGHLIHFLIGKESEVKAPHYIIITSNKGEDYLQNVGFAIEKLPRLSAAAVSRLRLVSGQKSARRPAR